VECLKKVKENAGKVYLCCVQARVMGLLEIARLDKIFVVVKDEEEARAR
jgi:anti-anti-sigma factor